MLRQQLAEAKADAQKRLEQLEAKLADAERAVRQAARELEAEMAQSETLREEAAALRKQHASAIETAQSERAGLQCQVEMLMADKRTQERTLASALNEQQQAQAQVAALERQVLL